MSHWSAGYVADVEYLPGFYAEQTPAHLDAACLIRGLEPPVRPGEPFRYCELGCGLGETAAVIAATNPRAEVYGFDFNPAQIARGQAFARDAGLTNLHLEEKSFEELAAPDAPALAPFDYVTIHGVWTWVSPANRAHILRFLERHVRPGGLVLVTYNALPGWTDMGPIQRLLVDLSRFDAERSDKRVARLLGFARAMSEAGSPALPKRLLDGLDDKKQAGNTVYLAHEYLNEHWAPAYHGDVAADLAKAKLDFAGTANILENFLDVCLTREQQTLLAQVPAAMQETLKDYFLARSFRRDIFVRGPRPITERRLRERQRQQRLTLARPLRTVSTKIKIPLGEADLTASTYEPAFAAMAEAVRSVGEIIDLPALAASRVNAGEMLGMTMGSKHALPAPNPVSTADFERVKAYNLAHLRLCAEEGRAIAALAGCAIGSAVHIGTIEMLTYEALATGQPAEVEPVVIEARRLLSERGGKLRQGEETIESEEENLGALRSGVAEILADGLPIWRRIGAI